MQVMIGPRQKVQLAVGVARLNLIRCKLALEVFAATFEGDSGPGAEAVDMLRSAINAGDEHLPKWEETSTAEWFDPEEAEAVTSLAVGFIYQTTAIHGKFPLDELAPGLFPSRELAQKLIDIGPENAGPLPIFYNDHLEE